LNWKATGGDERIAESSTETRQKAIDFLPENFNTALLLLENEVFRKEVY